MYKLKIHKSVARYLKKVSLQNKEKIKKEIKKLKDWPITSNKIKPMAIVRFDLEWLIPNKPTSVDMPK